MEVKVVCMACAWEVSGISVQEMHWAGLSHSHILDTGEGHGPVLLTADVWGWSPELWPDSLDNVGGSLKGELEFHALEKVWPLASDGC